MSAGANNIAVPDTVAKLIVAADGGDDMAADKPLAPSVGASSAK